MSRWILALLFAFASVTFLTACGGGEEASTDDAAEAVEEAAEGAEEAAEEGAEAAEEAADAAE